MKKQNILTVLGMTLLLLGCTAPARPAEPSVASPTAGISLTPTLPPILAAPSATRPVIPPTSTPEPALKTGGPYLAYFRYVDAYQLIFMDADGQGRRVIELPKEIIDSFMYNDRKPDTRLISPDGHWLAFYTGSAGSYTEMPAHGTADLTLNLLNLESGEQQVVTRLVSQGYPGNFAEAAQQLNNPEITARSLYEAFQSGITSSAAWSPDGRYLAFAGQMDGLSSDLYVYDLRTKAIDRLSSGDQEVQWISWSPDGRRILHGSVFWVGQGMSFDIYAARVDGSSAPQVSTSSLYEGITDWLNPYEYLEYDSQNGPGDYGLRSVNINTGETTSIWEGSFSSFGIDLSGKWVVLTALSPDASPYLNNLDPDIHFTPGLYLIELATMDKTHIRYPTEEYVISYRMLPVKSSQGIFFLNNADRAFAFYLSKRGVTTPYDLGNAQVSFSPHQKSWAAVTNQETRVFSMENEELNKIPFLTGSDPGTFEFFWRPDDSGFFLMAGEEIHSVDLEGNQAHLVETSLLNEFGLPVWVDLPASAQ